MIYTLLENNPSYCKPEHLYARKGDQMKMIRWNGPTTLVAIVEKDRDRFGIQVDKLQGFDAATTEPVAIVH